MTEPIVITVKRHKCPHCGRTWHARVRAVKHMALCWRNPANRGCKTCQHFQPAERDEDDLPGSGTDEACALNVTLVRPCATWCRTVCFDCPGKPGPIVHCDLWEADDAHA